MHIVILLLVLIVFLLLGGGAMILGLLYGFLVLAWAILPWLAGVTVVMFVAHLLGARGRAIAREDRLRAGADRRRQHRRDALEREREADVQAAIELDRRMSAELQAKLQGKQNLLDWSAWSDPLPVRLACAGLA